MGPKIKAGDHVLLGGTHASYPSHWVLGVVLWADGGDLLVERGGFSGDSWREVVHVSHVRAVGTISELVETKSRTAEAVRELRRVVDEREAELGRARDALWQRVEELAADGLKVIPPDFERIEADRVAVQDAMESADAAETPATPDLFRGA